MAYQSLYRRYRPRRFAEVEGQEHVVKALRNAVRADKVGHAYLFSGPRGCGKTTSARILAKVLNCERPVDGEPCCECASCKAVEAGLSYDVHELDAASNNGVDAIRDLIDKAMLGTPGRHKVYILDEVHMLTKGAEAALLKTLEEPPAHVVFVLATTDPQKISPTIISRTQHLQFHLLPIDVMERHLRWVIADAGLDVADDAIESILRQGGGSARDTLSALEQVVAAGGIAPDAEPLDELVEALIETDTGRALAAVAAAISSGRDTRTLAEHLVAQLRDAFLSLMAPELVQLPDRTARRVAEQARRLGPAATVRALEVLGEILVEFRRAPDPRLLLDIALVRLTSAGADTSTGALLVRIERLERALADGASSGRSTVAQAGGHSNVAQAGGRSNVSDEGPTAAASVAPAPSTATTQATAAAAAMAARVAGDPVAPSREQAVVRPPARPAAATTEASAPPTRPSGQRATLGARARGPQPAEPAPRVAVDRAAPSAAASPQPSVDTSSSLVGPAGSLPHRDQLTLAWADHVLPKLKGMARALYAPGRFVETGPEAVRYALPPNHPLARCEQHRTEVEAVLAAHFGRPVPLLLVTDGEPPPAADDADRAPATGPADDPIESIDPDELVDAPVGTPAPSSVERLAAAFPGAQILDETGPS
jgi:DNA polymerase-3 subunit gamma/tau